MNTCRYNQWILSYIDGTLNPGQEQEMRTHLESCRACQKIHSNILTAHRQLTESPHPKLPPSLISDFGRELNRQLSQRVPAHRPLRDTLKQIMNPKQWIRKTVYATALVVIGIFIGRAWYAPDSLPQRAESDYSVQSYTPLVSEYLVESEILLLALDRSSVEMPEHVLSFDRQLARSVLDKSRRIQPVLQQETDKQFIRFVNQLEMICMELTNRDPQQIRTTFNELKAMIRETGLIDETHRLRDELGYSDIPNI
ncbi:MAG: zf-HC2 domain-containing protein [candidate division KSB1 bacterium]|nr:zf-HC2 domain-containing protein [candidate division KSB1 bacterium]